MIRSTVFMVIRPERRGYDGKVTAIEIDRIVKNKPRLGVRDVAIKINLDVDPAMFTSPEPEVTINLNEHRAIILPVEAEVVVPDEQPEEQTDDQS